jgi:hypothetical protein
LTLDVIDAITPEAFDDAARRQVAVVFSAIVDLDVARSRRS